MNTNGIIEFPADHKAGFVSIVGKPNVGKSTLMNQLVGERLSIITAKAQTTRHRIMGILNGTHNGQEFQLVYSDTPGIIKPLYKLHESMMSFVRGSIEDADVVLFVTDIFEQHDENDVIERLQKSEVPVLLLINKIDQATQEQVEEKMAYWKERFNAQEIIPISALNGFNMDRVFEELISRLPQHPPYFPKDELTDKPERFFASEIIREKIFLNYKAEVPYSSEVVVTGFKEKDDIIVVQAEILVERATQRAILLGEGGRMIKKTGIMAREELERFFGKKVYLEQFVKVEPDWRQKERMLKRLGYDE
ncbi:GTPase Era [Spirosoma utsteinense]|uniref:GTPase Era n=1 Tax=Spirosoma utsteinense TaxID=2585773 RepID=A0ABR6W1Q5_9BACT|nr:GTPase Era [Spirosoma utsteinense]MBC3783698.1 GTP-binding protein Era [Spirosoma utsteinense]MBC3790159.1 GTP-binding protein Era [Spirosoma utsteinense]